MRIGRNIPICHVSGDTIHMAHTNLCKTKQAGKIGHMATFLIRVPRPSGTYLATLVFASQNKARDHMNKNIQSISSSDPPASIIYQKCHPLFVGWIASKGSVNVDSGQLYSKHCHVSPWWQNTWQEDLWMSTSTGLRTDLHTQDERML